MVMPCNFRVLLPYIPLQRYAAALFTRYGENWRSEIDTLQLRGKCSDAQFGNQTGRLSP